MEWIYLCNMEWIYLESDEYLSKNFRAVVCHTEDFTEKLDFYTNSDNKFLCSVPCEWGKHGQALEKFENLVKLVLK